MSRLFCNSIDMISIHYWQRYLMWQIRMVYTNILANLVIQNTNSRFTGKHNTRLVRMIWPLVRYCIIRISILEIWFHDTRVAPCSVVVTHSLRSLYGLGVTYSILDETLNRCSENWCFTLGILKNQVVLLKKSRVLYPHSSVSVIYFLLSFTYIRVYGLRSSI